MVCNKSRNTNPITGVSGEAELFVLLIKTSIIGISIVEPYSLCIS